MTDPLASKITEWANELEKALVELRLAGVPRGLNDEAALFDAIEDSGSEGIGTKLLDVWTEADRACEELRAMCEAAPLLQRVAGQLDGDAREALWRAVGLLSTVDFGTRLNILATQIRQLRELRTLRALN